MEITKRADGILIGSSLTPKLISTLLMTTVRMAIPETFRLYLCWSSQKLSYKGKTDDFFIEFQCVK